MLVSRDILPKIYSFIDRKEFIAIIGPRQSGKSTLLEIIESYLRNELNISSSSIKKITFEDLALRAAFESEPVGFINSLVENQTGPTYFLLDEYQYIQDGGQKLKFIYDTMPRVKIILTGSSSLDLRWQVGKFMVGRLIHFYLYPFNFREFLEGKDPTWERIYQPNHIKLISILKEGGKEQFSNRVDESFRKFNFFFEEYSVFGGYPAVVLEASHEIKQHLLRDLYNAFALRDVKDLLFLATDRELLLLSRYLAIQIGQILVYKNLSNVSGLEFRQVKKHLHILTETFIISLLTPYYTNKQKELSKNPKVYFVDSGLRNYLINNFNNFLQRPDVGQLVENMVWRRLIEIFDVVGNLSFWRNKAGSEVDFVVDYQGELIPIEVKYSEYRDARIPRHLKTFIGQYHPGRALVLNKNFWGRVEYRNCPVYFAPVYYL